MAVIILMGKMPKIKQGVDFMSKGDIDEMWVKVRDQLKDKKFLKALESFDIRKVRSWQVLTVKNLFANDPWMTTSWIKRESNFALYLFMWIGEILEYIEVANGLKKLGMKDIEVRRDLALGLKEKIQKVS